MNSKKDSIWLVFLKYPFDINHPSQENIKKKLSLTGLIQFVTKYNYFMVTGGLFNSLLLKWPSDYVPLPRYIPAKEFVDDIKTMLSWLEYRDDEDFENISEQYRGSMQSKLGKAVFEKGEAARVHITCQFVSV
jgi:hypothetical protein